MKPVLAGLFCKSLHFHTFNPCNVRGAECPEAVIVSIYWKFHRDVQTKDIVYMQARYYKAMFSKSIITDVLTNLLCAGERRQITGLISSNHRGLQRPLADFHDRLKTAHERFEG